MIRIVLIIGVEKLIGKIISAKIVEKKLIFVFER